MTQLKFSLSFNHVQYCAHIVDAYYNDYIDYANVRNRRYKILVGTVRIHILKLTRRKTLQKRTSIFQLPERSTCVLYKTHEIEIAI